MLPPNTTLNIGISGGLDSTLAGLVAVKACDLLGRDRSLVRGYTLPGFGTTDRTKKNALKFMALAGMTQETIDIRYQCIQMFLNLNHMPFGINLRRLEEQHQAYPKEKMVDLFVQMLSQITGDKNDLVFENVQARVRTSILMNKGFVVGTGDMSEAALGWSTYNGDQQSMYNPNCSIPKTLVRFLVDYVADQEEQQGNTELAAVLKDIVATTISPELLPMGEDGVIQASEDKLGPYLLHDFFLFHMVRNHYSPEKILYLASQVGWPEGYRKLIPRVKETFYRRFFAQQYKRSSAPDGPKVGSVDLSQRGSWRMPSDGDVSLWLE
jgi:NAD+ synthase (glutamine-hydrolysing)